MYNIKGSFFDMSIPWVVENENGYNSKINGTLMNPEATTSLTYRDFLQCETLEFQIDMIYPRYWNDYQEWIFTFTISKASLDFIFAHKWFFQVTSINFDTMSIFTFDYRIWLMTGQVGHHRI